MVKRLDESSLPHYYRWPRIALSSFQEQYVCESINLAMLVASLILDF